MAADLRGAIATPKPKHFAAITKPSEVGALMRALDGYTGYTSNEMTAHGFRAMAATLLNEMGQWHPDAIERQLAHVDTNQVRRAYARGEYWDERVLMMQHWSDYLDTLRDGGKVLQGHFGRNGVAG